MSSSQVLGRGQWRRLLPYGYLQGAHSHKRCHSQHSAGSAPNAVQLTANGQLLQLGAASNGRSDWCDALREQAVAWRGWHTRESGVRPVWKVSSCEGRTFKLKDTQAGTAQQGFSKGCANLKIKLILCEQQAGQHSKSHFGTVCLCLLYCTRTSEIERLQLRAARQCSCHRNSRLRAKVVA